MLPGMTPVVLGRPSQFITQVHSSSLEVSLSTSHPFADVGFGPEFAGRWVYVAVFGLQKPNGPVCPVDWATSSFVIGGKNAVGSAQGYSWSCEGSASTQFVGIATARAQPSGSEGSVSFNTVTSTRCKIIVLSIAGAGDISASGHDGAGGSGAGGDAGFAGNVDIPEKGLLIGLFAKMNANALTFGGVTEQVDESPLAGYRIGLAYSNGLAQQVGRGVSATSTGNARWAAGFTSLPAD